MSTRFSVQTVENINLGEVALVAMDESGYTLADIGSSYFRGMKGATRIATASRNGYRKYFFGWTEHDEDIPHDAMDFTKDFLVNPGSYANVRLAPNIDRYKKYIQLGSGAYVVRPPETTQLLASKAPPGAQACICTGCKEPVLQAAPNMADGSFKCYTCRNNPYR